MSSTTDGNSAPLSGRSAVITGASRGIGLECARVLHAAGARLVLVARSVDALARAGTELGSRTFAIACDMSEPDSVQAALQKIRLELSGAPDILINNAAQFFLAPIEQTSVSDFDRTLVVNLTSQFAFVREFLPDMRRRKRGHIVTIGSIAFLAGAVAGDTKNSLWALGLLAISYPVYLITRVLSPLQNPDMSG